MKKTSLMYVGIVLLEASLMHAQDNLPALSSALKPVLTEQELASIYETDDLDTQVKRMQKLIDETQDQAKQEALQTAINQTIQLAVLETMLAKKFYYKKRYKQRRNKLFIR